MINSIFIDCGDSTHRYIIAKEGTGIQISNNAIYKSDHVAPKGGSYAGDIWMRSLGLVNIASCDFHRRWNAILHVAKANVMGNVLVFGYSPTFSLRLSKHEPSLCRGSAHALALGCCRGSHVSVGIGVLVGVGGLRVSVGVG